MQSATRSAANGAVKTSLLWPSVCRRLLACASAVVVLSWTQHAYAQRVRITNLSDVNFGTISNLSANISRSQSICVFADSGTRGYNIRAIGSGASGAFTLADGAQTLSYEVQWSSSSGQTPGARLTPNVPLMGLTSTATHQFCNSGPATSARLILILRSGVLSNATAGSYSGSLTLVVAPE